MQYLDKLQRMLLGIGRSNSTAPPSQDPMNQLLHHLMTDDKGRKLFEGQFQQTLANIIEELGQGTMDKVVRASAATAKDGTKRETVLCSTANYQLQVSIKKGQPQFNKDLAFTELIKAGVDAQVVTDAFKKAAGFTAPAKTYTVFEKET